MNIKNLLCEGRKMTLHLILENFIFGESKTRIGYFGGWGDDGVVKDACYQA